MRKRSLVFLAIFSCLYALAQEQFSFRQLTVKEGLSQNSVVSIAQDSLGYLWLATQDGLNRYNGKSFKFYPFQFTDITRPTFSRLGKVYVDRAGEVFIIPSDNRIYKYDSALDNFFRVSTLTGITTFWQDSSKQYWAGTTDGNLFLLDSQFSISPSQVNINLKGQIKKIGIEYKENQGILSEKSLVFLDNKPQAVKEIILETLGGESIASNLNTAVISGKGVLWLGYYGDGLFYYDENTESIRRLNTASFGGYLPTDLMVIDLLFDSRQRLWVTTYGDGLYMIDFEALEIHHFSEQKENPRALHYNDILCVFEDDSGTLWFGTDGAGASFYDAYLEKFNSYTNYQTPSNINIDVVRAITLDNADNIYIGTSGKGLTKYEPATNSWISFTTLNSGISSDRIMSLSYDSNGTLWIGTQDGGLCLLKNDLDFKVFNEKSEIPLTAKTIWTIFEDSEQTLWLGTRDNGLVQFNKTNGVENQYTSFSVGDTSVTRKNIRAITTDPLGNFWIGTNNEGIVKFNPKTKESKIYTTTNSALSVNAIKSLFYDKNNLLWIGTSGGGLNAFDTKSEKFHLFSTKDGLPNDVVYGILPDVKGNLWLSSNKGITKFSISNGLNTQAEITNYDNYDGMATEFNTGAYYRHDDGQLYFGGLEGFYWFNPEKISEHTFLPKTAITEFKVLDTPRSIYTDTVLRYNQNTLDFTFSSLQFSEPGKNQYRYRLLPFESEWVESGNKNFVRYTRLAPDDYEFQVLSSNYDGNWNTVPEKFSFKITPPWYFNFWSKSIYLLLLVFTGILIYRYLKWRWKMKMDLQLKQEEANSFRELSDYKSKIYTEIAHEFRTPLTLISGPIESKLAQPGISEEEVASFSMVERNTTRLTNLVDQLLQLARLEEGKFSLNEQWGNLGLFLKTLAASFEFEARQKDIDYHYQVLNIAHAFYDEDAIEKILVNMISNALKHGKQNGRCRLTMTHAKDTLIIKIENDTKSTLQDVQKIFDRFYQENKEVKGAGIGLSLVQELVRLCDGEIKVSQKKNRIKFTISIPMKTSNIGMENEEVLLEEDLAFRNSDAEAPILLIVEDNSDVRSFIRSEFQKTYKVITSKDGKSGMEKAFETVPDIIISDVMMPVIDGIELCNTLKADERTSHIPILLLTASTDRKKELIGLKAGADDYITKPFKIKILEKRVSNLVKSRRLLRDRYSQENFIKPKDIAITPTDEQFLNKVQKVMDEHLANPEFNAARFSEEVAMSRMQLHRKLMTYTGLSTSAFIRSQRLKQAVQILKKSDATVNEVAYTVGFNTPSYFIKCFKETYKKTPTEYFQSTR